MHAPSTLHTKLSLHLQFSSPQEQQAHTQNRNTAGNVGTLAGSALGGAIGGRLKGPVGLLAGAVGGGLLGRGVGKQVTDLAHDIPQRTSQQYNDTVRRLGLAGGEGVRVAAALPSLTEFLEFADSHAEGMQTPVDATDDLLAKREESPRFGAEHSIEGGDVASRATPLALPAYGGV